MKNYFRKYHTRRFDFCNTRWILVAGLPCRAIVSHQSVILRASRMSVGAGARHTWSEAEWPERTEGVLLSVGC